MYYARWFRPFPSSSIFHFQKRTHAYTHARSKILNQDRSRLLQKNIHPLLQILSILPSPLPKQQSHLREILNRDDAVSKKKREENNQKTKLLQKMIDMKNVVRKNERRRRGNRLAKKVWRKRRGFHHEQDARDTAARGSWRDGGARRGGVEKEGK